VTTEATSPQRSTRDPEELRARLEAWMRRRLPPGNEARVPALTAPSANGMSSETLLFDAMWREGDREHEESLVARLAPEATAVPVFPAYDFQRQFDVIRLVGEKTSVPVPRARWLELDTSSLGAPFFVMERVDGEVPPDIMPYNFGSWLSDASSEEQAKVQAGSVIVLAELHGIEDAEEAFAFLDLDRPGSTPLQRHVADQWAYYRWAMDDIRVPVLEWCFAWLEEHWPDDEAPTVVCWGDARVGNVMYRNFDPVAVLDWEMAALAPPELDLGWMITLHRFFEELAAQYGLPGMPHFLRRDDVAATYESLTGHAPRHLDFYTMYAALRHGIVMARIHRRAMHFGEATMPDDPDDLVAHRAMLEAMLAGTYWSRL
jgi:aminoglycoside phosphotransferase (APT) family kinase protein